MVRNHLFDDGDDGVGHRTTPTPSFPRQLSNNQDRAKSRVVALGNHEETEWTKAETFAPVLRDESSRVMTTMAIEHGRIEKQGNCKNAFVQSELPKDEIIIVRPPPGCPLSKPGELWLLQKTLYGLRRSPYHWYNRIKKILLSIGLSMSPHDPCVFFGQLRDDLPPIYVGLYVDDFKYWSTSDETEKLFEKRMQATCKVDFMGAVSWFLGSKYEWSYLTDGRLSVSITQTAKTEALLEAHGMADCNPAPTPYKSGIHVDRLPQDGLSAEQKPLLVRQYTSLIGGLVWLQRQTRPDISTITRLLARYNHNPSYSHYQAAKYVLAYLKGTIDRGIRYTQGGRDHELQGYTSFPVPDGAYTDANWGPQDASHPKPDEIVTEEEVKSLLGHVIFRQGGPVIWGCHRESETISGSSCESEIYATNEGTKSVLTLRHLLQDLGAEDGTKPTPIWNDNKGTVEWAQGCTVSRNLRHVNMRNLLVRLHQRLGNITIHHIEGKLNVADLFTKEMKDSAHYLEMVEMVTSPRVLSLAAAAA